MIQNTILTLFRNTRPEAIVFAILTAPWQLHTPAIDINTSVYPIAKSKGSDHETPTPRLSHATDDAFEYHHFSPSTESLCIDMYMDEDQQYVQRQQLCSIMAPDSPDSLISSEL